MAITRTMALHCACTVTFIIARAKLQKLHAVDYILAMSSLLSSFQQYLPAAAIIVLPNAGGMLSSLFTKNEPRGPWYNSLKKPSFNPPNWIFAPVWTTIYACMGVSSYLIYKQGGFEAQSLPLALYGTQLLLNWAWTPIFFYFHRIDLVKK